MSTTEYAHVVLDDYGVSCLEGTHIKVVEIVLDHLAYGSDAQEVQRQFPHLGMASIYSALAYYYDHQTQMDEDIARRLQATEAFREKFGSGPLGFKLREKGLL